MKPCIPREWPHFSVRYRFGSALYEIEVKNPERKSAGASAFAVDGERIEAADADGPFVTLRDDGRPHRVTLTL